MIVKKFIVVEIEKDLSRLLLFSPGDYKVKKPSMYSHDKRRDAEKEMKEILQNKNSFTILTIMEVYFNLN